MALTPHILGMLGALAPTAEGVSCPHPPQPPQSADLLGVWGPPTRLGSTLGWEYTWVVVHLGCSTLGWVLLTLTADRGHVAPWRVKLRCIQEMGGGALSFGLDAFTPSFIIYNAPPPLNLP